MKKLERYTVELDAYVWAENDEQAKLEALKLARKLQSADDNQARVISLYETPFASLVSRRISIE